MGPLESDYLAIYLPCSTNLPITWLTRANSLSLIAPAFAYPKGETQIVEQQTEPCPRPIIALLDPKLDPLMHRARQLVLYSLQAVL